eukprot:scaffold6241_cov129-Cylindrotheca_fusiformis.AAC.5
MSQRQYHLERHVPTTVPQYLSKELNLMPCKKTIYYILVWCLSAVFVQHEEPSHKSWRTAASRPLGSVRRFNFGVARHIRQLRKSSRIRA